MDLWYSKIFLCLLLYGTLSAHPTHDRHQHVHVPGCRGVHYRELGCFDHFNNTHWLPQSPDFVDTTFYLYTQSDPTEPHILNAENEETIRSSSFDPSLPIKFLVHGFLQHGHSEFLLNMMRALLDYAPMNVIVVGWGGGAGFPYTQAVANTRIVGAEIARLIRVLGLEDGRISANQIHVVGHSLGAHIAGYAGARTPGLGRISALDPAQPNYEGHHRDERLDTSDATFVDVIHTDAMPYDTVRGYGMINPVGHVDFYPNGGHHQPGCHEESSLFGVLQDAWNRGIVNAEGSVSCSHERSTVLFTDSITRPASPCDFRSFPCESETEFMEGRCLHCGNRPCPLMGFHADKSFGARGTFYLNTTRTEPFCGHLTFVTVKLSANMSEVGGTISVKVSGSTGQSEMTHIKSGLLSPGGVYTGLVLDQTSLGQINRVEVHFEQTPSYFSMLRSHRVILHSVGVNSVLRMPTKYFCQSEMTVSTGQQIVLTSGSFLQSDCS